MSSNPLPTLTSDGWIYNKETLIERLFIYFLASDVYQSNTFKDHIYSLKGILQSHSKSRTMEEEISTGLIRLYEPYFPIVEPKVTVEDTGTRLKYVIDIDFKDSDGKSYQFSRILQMRENNIENFQELLFNYKAIKKDEL